MAFDPTVLERIIKGSGIPFRQNTIAWIFACPRCSKKDKLYIRKRDGRFVCWVCREIDRFQGRPEFALRELLDRSLKDLQEELYGDDIPDQMVEFELDLRDLLEEEDEIALPPEPKVTTFPFDFYGPEHPLFADGARYLHGRGMNIDHVRTYDIRYCPAYTQGSMKRSDRRVIFPVKIDGELIGWQARLIDPSEHVTEDGRVFKIPKILTSESLRDTGARFLMFQDRLKASGHCVLAEGPVSAIKAHLCGGNVASMGKAVTERQLETVLSSGIKKVYLALDRDAAEDATRLLHLLPEEIEVFLLLPPAHRDDLGDATQEEVFEQFMRAPRLERDTLMLSLGDELVL